MNREQVISINDIKNCNPINIPLNNTPEREFAKRPLNIDAVLNDTI